MSTTNSLKNDISAMEFELSGQSAAAALKVLENSWTSASFGHKDISSMLNDIDSTLCFIADFRARLVKASLYDNPLVESTFCAADTDSELPRLMEQVSIHHTVNRRD